VAVVVALPLAVQVAQPRVVQVVRGEFGEHRQRGWWSSRTSPHNVRQQRG